MRLSLHSINAAGVFVLSIILAEDTTEALSASPDAEDTMQKLEYAAAWPCGMTSFYRHNKANASTIESLVGKRRSGQQSLQKEAKNVRCGFMQPVDMELAHSLSLVQQQTSCSIVLATTIFHNYDKFNHSVPSIHNDNSTCFFAFLDAPTCLEQAVGTRSQCNVSKNEFHIFRQGLWNVVVLDVCRFGIDDIRRASRIPKMLGHRFFPRARYFISIDAREQIQVTPTRVVEDLLIRPKKQFLAQQHPARTPRSVYDEGHLVARVKLAAASDITAQLERYALDELPENHEPKVHEMGFFAYDIQSLDIQAMLCAWFDEYMQGSVRDQVCWSYVVWKLGLYHRIHSVPYKTINRTYLRKGSHRVQRAKSVPISCPPQKYEEDPKDQC